MAGTSSELEDLHGHQVSRGHSFRVVHIARSVQRRPGPCPYRCARISSDEIDAEPGDNGTRVVFVQIVQDEAVVEQGRRLVEDLTSHLEIPLGSCLGYCICGSQELILEGWPCGGGRHTASLSTRSRPGKRIWHQPAYPVADGGACRGKSARVSPSAWPTGHCTSSMR